MIAKTPKPTHTSGMLTLDARTIGMAILFLVGGGATGAGTSMLGGSRVEERVESLSAEVRALTRSVDQLATQKDRSDDHEARIRRLEEKRPR